MQSLDARNDLLISGYTFSLCCRSILCFVLFRSRIDKFSHFLLSQFSFQEATDDIAKSQHEYVPVLLQIIHKNCPPAPENCDGGVYVGAAGIAYAFYHVAESGLFEDKREHFLSVAEKYIKV